jgi:hypothetical protein
VIRVNKPGKKSLSYKKMIAPNIVPAPAPKRKKANSRKASKTVASVNKVKDEEASHNEGHGRSDGCIPK